MARTSMSSRCGLRHQTAVGHTPADRPGVGVGRALGVLRSMQPAAGGASRHPRDGHRYDSGRAAVRPMQHTPRPAHGGDFRAGCLGSVLSGQPTACEQRTGQTRPLPRGDRPPRRGAIESRTRARPLFVSYGASWERGRPARGGSKVLGREGAPMNEGAGGTPAFPGDAPRRSQGRPRESCLARIPGAHMPQDRPPSTRVETGGGRMADRVPRDAPAASPPPPRRYCSSTRIRPVS